MDYSNARLITIQNGIARKQDGTFKVIHSINLEQYQALSEDLESIVDANITYSHPLRPFLTQQVISIKGLLRRLAPNRPRRSIDFIGSAWKWIAGTPDSHDFEILDQKIGNLLENNNRQLIINELTTDRIREISNITNEILKVRKEDWNNELASNLEHKLILIEKELQNIEYAIQWARVNIVNSFILSKTEVETLNDVLTTYNIPLFSIDELLSFGNVKIVTNSKEILYILSIPITENKVCKMFLAKPVKIGYFVDKIEFNKILNCNNVLFAIKDNCKNYNELTICNRDKLIELKEDYCITNLFKNKIGNCTQVNNEHIPTIEEIESDLILLNQYDGTIKVNEEEIGLNGTYLVKYFNTTIYIDNREFFSKEVSGSKPLPAFLQPKANNVITEEVLSLERIQKINLENIKRLELIEHKNNILTSSSIIAIAATFLAVVWILVKRKINQRNCEMDTEKNSQRTTVEEPNMEPKANTVQQEKKTVEIEKKRNEKKNPSIYDLQTF